MCEDNGTPPIDLRTLWRGDVLQAARVLKPELLLEADTGVEVGKALAAEMGLIEERREDTLFEVEGDDAELLVEGDISKRLLAGILLRVGVLKLSLLGNWEVLLSPVEACGVMGVLNKAKLLRKGIRFIDSLRGVVAVLAFLCGVVFCFLALVKRARFIKECGVLFGVQAPVRFCGLIGVFKPVALPGVMPILEPSLVTSIILEVSVELLTLITEQGVSKALLLVSVKTGVEGNADKPNRSSADNLLHDLSTAAVCVIFFLAEAFKADFKYGLAGLNLFGVVKSIKCIEEFLSTFEQAVDILVVLAVPFFDVEGV